MSAPRPAMASAVARSGAPVVPNQAPHLGTYVALTAPHVAGERGWWEATRTLLLADKTVMERMSAAAVTRIDLPQRDFVIEGTAGSI